MDTPTVARPPSESLILRLLNGFQLKIGPEDVALPMHAQRVLAYLALHESDQSREAVAGKLWMDVPQERAQASLRTALWRIRCAHPHLLRISHGYVRVSDELEIDLRRALSYARRLLSTEQLPVDVDGPLDLLEADLLPFWDEDWVMLERERIRQIRIHALEALSRRLTILGRYVQAIEAAHAAVRAEPLRESAQTVLIEAHLAEGNYSEARRQFELFRCLLQAELGAQPGTELSTLVNFQRRSRQLRSNLVEPEPSNGFANRS